MEVCSSKKVENHCAGDRKNFLNGHFYSVDHSAMGVKWNPGVLAGLGID